MYVSECGVCIHICVHVYVCVDVEAEAAVQCLLRPLSDSLLNLSPPHVLGEVLLILLV